MISLNGITKKYDNRTVLCDLHLKIDEGESICITGESGVGKSTLLNIIGMLDTDYDGEYLYKENVITQCDSDEFRNRHIGFIFQQFNLLSNLSIIDNILLPYTFCDKDFPDIYIYINTLLDRFGLKYYKERAVNTLSGGEQQRVALIRSIILNPMLIIADEPTGNLDERNGRLVVDFLHEMNNAGKSIVVVTHNTKFAREFDTKYKIKGGRLYENPSGFKNNKVVFHT
jgi:ABC-type lipoprotein export system ATPase subunit